MAIILAAIVGGASTAFVMAAIPSSNGNISGCYNKNNGNLSVIDSEAGDTCSAKQSPISWSQSGGPGSFVSNLVGADFSNNTLSYRNFVSVDLHNAKFGGAIITGSDFHGANLQNTVFDGATITKSNFHSANLTGTSFQSVISSNNADFSSANLSNSTLDFEGDTYNSFAGANLSNAKLIYVKGNFQGANLHGVMIYGALTGDYTGIDFRTSQFIPNNNNSLRLGGSAQSVFKNANFTGITLSSVAIQWADYTGANFSGTKLNGTTFGAFDFSSGNPVASTQNAPDMTNTNFSNAQFVDAQVAVDLSSANLTGATWSNTICPDGTNSDSHSSTCVGHLVP